MTFEGPVVCITAGWRESEGELNELEEDIGHPVEDLQLYHLAQDLFIREPELYALQRERQDKLVELQSLYRIRLAAAMSSATQLMNHPGNLELLRLEQRAAISQVRALDRHHVRRIDGIHRSFDQRRAQMEIPGAEEIRSEVQQKLSNAGLVIIAGGHVAVLLNRIRLFRLQEILAKKPVIAWSAGAMVLAERIVLFHDDAPQGSRDVEVLDAGLGIVKGLIPLPHAKSRLDWSSQNRMALFSRRFSPAWCCTLDSGSSILVRDNKIITASGSSVITRSGRKKQLRAK
jgi:peptidase E